MTTPAATNRPRRVTDAVAVILAVGICTALNVFTIAVLTDAVFSAAPGLSENSTQILNSWGTGIIGIIGAVVGYRAGASTRPDDVALGR